MIKLLKIFAALILIIFITAIAGYVAWFQNTEEHTLQLNPAEVFSDKRGDDYLITHANIVDVENGVVLENRHLLIQNGRIERIFEGAIPDNFTQNYPVTDAGKLFLMPALFDMHAHLNSGELIPPDDATRLMALEQFAELVSPMIFATGDFLTSPGGYPIPFLSQMLGIPAGELNLNEQGVIEVTDATDLKAIMTAKRELGLHGVKVMVESRLVGATAENRISNEQIEQIAQTASEADLPVFAHVTNLADFEAANHINTMIEDSVYVTPSLLMSYPVRFLQTA